jgi:ABC-type thiamine transport system ATPase subunit
MAREPKASTLNTHNSALNRVFDEGVARGLINKTHLPTLINKSRDSKALARALIRTYWQDRQLLLFNDPFSTLDNKTGIECIDVIKQLVNRKHIAALMVSHNPDDAKRLGAKVALA